jgi:hypothetical protein
MGYLVELLERAEALKDLWRSLGLLRRCCRLGRGRLVRDGEELIRLATISALLAATTVQ